MSLCAPAAQSTAVLQTHTDLEAHPKCNMEKSIVLLTELCAAILPHACSTLGEILWKTTGLFAEQGTIQNEWTWQNSSNYLLFINTWEPTRNRKSSDRHPPRWMHTGRAHMLHYKEADPFCPHGTHKDSFIPCSPSIPTQNGMYWHQVNSLPTTESQCCTNAVCSKALGFHAWLYGASPAPRGGGGRGESSSSNKRDSSWLPNTFLAKLTWAMATQSSCCQRPWVRPSLWPQI